MYSVLLGQLLTVTAALLENRIRVKRVQTVSFILITLLMAISLKGGIAESSDQQEMQFTIRMDVTYSNPNHGEAVWNFTEEDQTLGLFMNNAWQTVELTGTSLNLQTTRLDEDENPVAILDFQRSNLKPGENLSFTATFQASSKPRSVQDVQEEKSEALDKIPTGLKEKYCKKGDAWQVDDQSLQLLARSIAGKETKTLTIVKEFIVWIKRNIGYFVHEIPSYPNETLASRKGDCDDQAIFLVTLCRIVGIPAYLQVGCIYQPTRAETSETYWDGHVTDVLTRIAWHGWAVAYIPPWGFLPIDLTYVADFSDPLNAIRGGAVTLRETIQYMNVSQSDYIIQTRNNKEFLEKNNFYIFMKDHMTQITLQSSPWQEIIDFGPYLTTLVVIFVLSSFLLYVRRIRKRTN